MSTNLKAVCHTLLNQIEDRQYEGVIQQCQGLMQQLGEDPRLLFVMGRCYEGYHKFELALVYYYKLLLQVHDESYALHFAAMLSKCSKPFYEHNPDLLSSFAKILSFLSDQRALKERAPFLVAMLQQCGFGRSEEAVDHDRLLMLFDLMILPLLHARTEQQDYQSIYDISQFCYIHVVKSAESERIFASVAGKTAPILAQAGAAFSNHYRYDFVESPPDNHKIAFVFEMGSLLAHTETLVSFLEGWHDLGQVHIEPIIIVLGKSKQQDAFYKLFQKFNLPLIDLSEQTVQCFSQGKVEALLPVLRETLQRHDIYRTVWLGPIALMSLIYGFRVAKHQIYFSLKYSGIDIDAVDRYVVGIPPGSLPFFSQTQWRGGCFSLRSLPDVSIGDVETLRARFPTNKKIVATLARSELIGRVHFLETVKQILQRDEATIFLWTGKKEDPSISQFFQSNHLADRVYFIGWVDINYFRYVVDLFLDPFPYGSGVNLLRTLEVGKSVVLSPIEGGTTYFHIINYLVDNHPEVFSQSESSFWHEYQALAVDYLELTHRLLSDDQFYACSTQFFEKMVKHFFCDQKRFFNQFYQHFLVF